MTPDQLRNMSMQELADAAEKARRVGDPRWILFAEIERLRTQEFERGQRDAADKITAWLFGISEWHGTPDEQRQAYGDAATSVERGDWKVPLPWCRCNECKITARAIPGERHKDNPMECAGRWIECADGRSE